MRIILKYTITVLFTLFFLIKPACPQDTVIHHISWLPPVPSWFSTDSASGKVLLNFQDARYDTNGLPVFRKIFPVDDSCTEIGFKIVSMCFDTIPLSPQFSRMDELSGEIQFSAHILKAEKKNFGQISVIPVIRKNEKLFLLKSFTAVITPKQQFTTRKSAELRWKQASALRSGVWKKIAVSQTGIYKITFSELKNMGFSNPADIKIYGNGGEMLPEKFSELKADDLNEIHLFLSKGQDGIFNEGDFLLFYAQGPVVWSYNTQARKFTHSKHLYTDKIIYFLTTGQGNALIPDAEPVNEPESFQVNTFVDHLVHEENLYNLIKSGRNWVGEHFGIQSSRNFPFTIPDPAENSEFTLEAEVLARSGITSAFAVRYNNQTLVTQLMNSVFINDETSNHADVRTFISRQPLTGTAKDIVLTVLFDNRGNNSAEGWLNYIRLNVKRKLQFNGDQLFFRDTTGVFRQHTAMYTIANAAPHLLLWDVTNLNSVKNIKYTLSGQQLSFKGKTDTMRNYVLFDPAKALTPDFLKEEGNHVENQNLHGTENTDMVIIAHPSLIAEARELADIHRTMDQLKIVTVTPGQIYNEFSSGNPDPAAYRNFMKMFYDRAPSVNEQPRYLLLMGDGSYKNFSGKGDNNTNLILTYQSANSLRPVSSYVSDDYFGLLDDNEGIENGLLDIGIGRFPVSTVRQAKAVVNKIKRYISAESSGGWRNMLCFFADDEDGNIHMAQADQMTTFLGNNYPVYNHIKLYADAYPQVTTSAGPRYPEMNKAIENTLNRGVLIMNYTGHGGKEGLAHEQILRQEEVKGWKNTVYPLFVTATCEFSRFDDYEITTAGENVLLNENGGGIALLTTTRLVYSGPNFVLNQEFYKNFNARDANGEYLRLGDILKRTKNASGSDINKLSFTLLGDPALRLAYPKKRVETTHINGNDAGTTADTLKAYREVTVKGRITDYAGNPETGFNGIVYPVLYDKEQQVKTLNNDNGSPFYFRQQESILYKGKATVRSGEFEFSFVVPREIAYNFGSGRLSYYAASENSDATGFFNNFVIGGIEEGAGTDNKGPDIRLYLNDRNFVNGGVTNQFPVLLADLSDESGINISGTGIGHNLVGVLDNNTASSFVLNNYYESAIDDYRQGTVTFRLPALSPGKHTLSVKAWDIFNNSSLQEIAFEVTDSSTLQVKNLTNYPNPFSGSTTFSFEHNQPGKNLDTELQIFSISGNLIHRERFIISTEGFHSGPILWDGNKINYKKPERGIYIYRFIFRYKGKEIISDSKKMVVSE